VLTTNGWKTIGTLLEESIPVALYSWDPNASPPTFHQTRLVGIHHAGKQEVWEMRLKKEGEDARQEIERKLDATPEHKFLCQDKNYHTVKEIFEKSLVMVSPTQGNFRISGIESTKIREVYSLEVENELHNYLGDYGLVEKNSHSVGYATLSAQCLYLKHFYLLEYFCAVLNSYLLNSDKIKRTLGHIYRQGLVVTPPDINKSQEEFSIEKNKILTGLLGIKGIGAAAIKEIMAKRPFTSFQDFMERCEKKKVNKARKTALAKAGAFDSLITRPKAISLITGESRSYTEQELGMMEMEVIGRHLVYNPYLGRPCFLDGKVTQVYDLGPFAKDCVVSVVGVISSWKEKTAKTGKKRPYVEFELSSPFGSINGLIFADVLKTISDEDRKKYIQGKEVVIDGKLIVEDEDDFANSAKLIALGVYSYKCPDYL